MNTFLNFHFELAFRISLGLRVSYGVEKFGYQRFKKYNHVKQGCMYILNNPHIIQQQIYNEDRLTKSQPSICSRRFKSYFKVCYRFFQLR